jgi:hypothetical protein
MRAKIVKAGIDPAQASLNLNRGPSWLKESALPTELLTT